MTKQFNTRLNQKTQRAVKIEAATFDKTLETITETAFDLLLKLPVARRGFEYDARANRKRDPQPKKKISRAGL